MDLWTQFALWAVLGAILCGIIGQSRDQLGMGLAIGVLLGPLIGGVIAWFAIPRSQGQPERQP